MVATDEGKVSAAANEVKGQGVKQGQDTQRVMTAKTIRTEWSEKIVIGGEM